MSAWAQLNSLGSSLIKRPAVWLGGVFVAAVGTYATTNLLTPMQTFLSEKTAEISCRYRQRPISNESQFTILVSPLAHDPDRSHTERVMRAFLGEKGFLVVPICESLNFDYSVDVQTGTDEALQRAREMIRVKHADLLLFGDVRDRDKAVMIYAMNEHGGCDLRPKPTIIEHGDLPDDFNAAEKENLIAVSLREIGSACLNLTTFPSSHAKYIYLAKSYVKATRLLYSNGQGESWYVKGENFSKKITSQFQGNKADLSGIWTEYAVLLNERFKRTTTKNDEDAAGDAFDSAIGLDPKNSTAYFYRGTVYADKGDFDRAFADFDQAIRLDPKDAYVYTNRGWAYATKGDFDRAFADFDQAIALDLKNAGAYTNRGWAYVKKGDFDHGIADYDKAIGLDPKNAGAYSGRGYAYAEMGYWDRAIEDYDKAIGLDPKITATYSSRGIAYSNKDDWDRAIVDYTKAIGLDPKDAAAYSNRGFAYLTKGDFERAIADYDQAIGLDPKDAFAHDARGDAYKKKGDLDRAIEDYTKAIGLYPKDKDYYRSVAYGSRAAAYLSKGDKKRSFADFKKGMELGSAPQ
jgi:tetratricopeptide (TPR) repeat protein